MNDIISYPSSAIFYFSILLLSVLLSYLASKSKTLEAKVYNLLIILLLTSVAGFRGINVGIDTKNYLEVIEQIESMIGTYRIKPTEMGYAYFVIILKSIINSPQVILITSALITNTLIIARLWSFRKQASFSFAIFLYVSMYFVLTLNTMRQWIAIAIIFFAIKYLFEEKYLKFIILVLIASTFHTTALITIPFIPIFLFYKSKDSLKSRKQLKLSILLSPIFVIGSFLLLRSTSAVSQYDHYFRDPELEFSLSWFIRVLIVLFIVFLVNPKSSGKTGNTYLESNTSPKEFIDFYKIIRVITVVGLLLKSIGLFYEYTARAGLYYSITEIILFSIVIKSNSYGAILRIVIIILAMLTFYSAMKDSGYGQMPYIPFWKN